MAADSSFDVVSRVDQQELANALNQARQEIAGRFDFKNSKTSIENSAEQITIIADDELKMRNVIDMIQGKAVKRGISLKALEFGKPEPAAQQTVQVTVKVRSGIPKDKSKPLIDAIKAAKLKVQTQFQDEQIRVSGKSRDDLAEGSGVVTESRLRIAPAIREL